MELKSINEADNFCFACSPRNPIGLKLAPEMTEDTCRVVFTPQPEHQGWVGFMHGGLISTILDEVMAQWLWRRNKPAVTAEMNIRFLKPVPIGEQVTAAAECSEERGRIVKMTAELVLKDGNIAAKAAAKFFVLPKDQKFKNDAKKERGFIGEAQ